MTETNKLGKKQEQMNEQMNSLAGNEYYGDRNENKR